MCARGWTKKKFFWRDILVFVGAEGFLLYMQPGRKFSGMFFGIPVFSGKPCVDKVTLLCPIAESVPPQAFQSALVVVGYAVSKQVEVGYIGITERTLVDTARNVLVKQFLKTDSDSEWAFWMDADMVLPKDTIVKLLDTAKKKNAKMVTGVYYQRGGNHWPVCWVRDPKLENGKNVSIVNKDEYDNNSHLGIFAMPGPDAKEPFLADTAGFGCCLIHRSVFEATEEPWFLFKDGKCSEDFYFFVNAKKKGFELWADPSLRIGHIGQPKVIYRDQCYETMKENETHLFPIKKEVVHA